MCIRDRKELAEFKTYLSQQEPQLDKARALDVQLVENRKQLAESQKEAALALQAKDNLRQSVCKTEKDISLLMEKQTDYQLADQSGNGKGAKRIEPSTAG
mgnify:CR=1 FL=1